MLGISLQSMAQQRWTVQPSSCIVDTLGDECEMQLNIMTRDLTPGDYCYFQDQVQLSCWHTDEPITQVHLRFTQPTVVLLKNAQGQIMLTHSIDIKSRESSRKTRRVRQPWSLF